MPRFWSMLGKQRVLRYLILLFLTINAARRVPTSTYNSHMTELPFVAGRHGGLPLRVGVSSLQKKKGNPDLLRIAHCKGYSSVIILLHHDLELSFELVHVRKNSNTFSSSLT